MSASKNVQRTRELNMINLVLREQVSKKFIENAKMLECSNIWNKKELTLRNQTPTTERWQLPTTGKRLKNSRSKSSNGSNTFHTRRKPKRLPSISTRPPKEWSMISLLVKLTPSTTPVNWLVLTLDGLSQDAIAMLKLLLNAFKEKESNMVKP